MHVGHVHEVLFAVSHLRNRKTKHEHPTSCALVSCCIISTVSDFLQKIKRGRAGDPKKQYFHRPYSRTSLGVNDQRFVAASGKRKYQRHLRNINRPGSRLTMHKTKIRKTENPHAQSQEPNIQGGRDPNHNNKQKNTYKLRPIRSSTRRRNVHVPRRNRSLLLVNEHGRFRTS